MRQRPLDSPHMMNHALNYARRGFKVFPCYEPIYGGCTCGNPDCENIGKHPRTKNGLKDATADAEQIRRWWKQWPDANIGLSCENLIVIDIDADKGGYSSLEKLETEFGALPPTWTVETGGGGRHYFFQRNGHTCKNGTGIRPGLDIKTNGGYVIAVPSLHKSGKRYAWSNVPFQYKGGNHA